MRTLRQKFSVDSGCLLVSYEILSIGIASAVSLHLKAVSEKLNFNIVSIYQRPAQSGIGLKTGF